MTLLNNFKIISSVYLCRVCKSAYFLNTVLKWSNQVLITLGKAFSQWYSLLKNIYSNFIFVTHFRPLFPLIFFPGKKYIF